MSYNMLMTKIGLDDVQHLAQLSNLRITDDEAQAYPEQLSESISYVENLDEVDTSKVPDTFFTTDATNVMDEDVVDESLTLSHEEAIRNATSSKDGYFVVKRIL